MASASARDESRPNRTARTALGVFGILLASYAFFWHARDWNSASRLMLTYALVDRGTIVLDGLEDQTGDKASFRGRYYTDKLPGFSLLAVPAYAVAKGGFGLPDHPLGRRGFAFWPADYWTTLGTSGLLTAWAAALLVGLAGELGCGPRRAALVGLAYGLATPAYVYATLAYGHQAAAFALLGAFVALRRGAGRRAAAWAFLAGALAATAAVIELQVGPVSAILGLHALGRVRAGRLPAAAAGAFAVGAILPTLVLLGYDQLAFGSPWDMGYFHHATRRFAAVHSRANPLGLRAPDWGRAADLLVGRRRGLFLFAPIVLLAAPGWGVLGAKRLWGEVAVTGAACVAIFVVNLSYPEWTGGWSTGPRLLVPLLPFAMVPVAALLAVGGRRATAAAGALAVAGGAIVLLFQGVGGRIPEFVADPLGEAVWPLWRGAEPPGWVTGGRFTRTVVGWAWPAALGRLPETRRWVEFLPLLAFQAAAIAAIMARPARASIDPSPRDGRPIRSTDPGAQETKRT